MSANAEVAMGATFETDFVDKNLTPCDFKLVFMELKLPAKETSYSKKKASGQFNFFILVVG